MSMTIRSKIKGVTDLSLLIEALGQMGNTASVIKNSKKKVNGKTVLAIANIDGYRVGFTRDQNDELVMVGDDSWPCMKNKRFIQQLTQQYGVATVKRKAKELQYNIASVESLEDGSIKIVARAWR